MKPAENNSLSWRGLLLRLMVTGVVLAIWFWTQSLLGARNVPSTGVGDALHHLTASLNSYFAGNPGAANALLIGSSAIIDALGLFLLGSWLFGGSIRPFLGLVMLMLLRQLVEALCSLPVPPGMIWHDPGFPSVLVTYHVANDSSFLDTRLSRFSGRWNSRASAAPGSRPWPSCWSYWRSLPF